jgi:hypothetical protein
VWLVTLAACSDYQIGTKPDPVIAPPDDSAPMTEPPPVHSADPVEHTGEPPRDSAPPPTCADEPLPVFSWTASAPFPEMDHPVDPSGLVFHDPAAQPTGWVPIALPDRGIPIGTDRAYRAEFTLAELPIDLSLDLQSDDGITVWVNGTQVGHWGGAWQVEGCVNERAQCVVTTSVPAFEITPLLVVGTNVIAARVSNPVQNAYFAVSPLCVDR